MSGIVMLDLEGLQLTAAEREMIKHPQVAGLILFSRNYESPAQLKELVHEIHDASAQRLLIGVDQEGGRVQRFRAGFTSLPALGAIGDAYSLDPDYGLYFAKSHGFLMATELLSLGIDFSFSPVLDLGKGISQVIGDRAFHQDPKVVTLLAKAYIQSMKQAGMSAIGKHFPGHGSVAADSHTEIPVDFRQFKQIAKEDLIPFAKLMNDLAGIMPAHVVYPEVDVYPAGFSEQWLKHILRETLGFQGAIISDDLGMQGACQMGDMLTRAQTAIQAGCDLVLICNDRQSACETIAGLETCAIKRDNASGMRLARLFGQRRLTRKELIESPQWLVAQHFVQNIPVKNKKSATILTNKLTIPIE